MWGCPHFFFCPNPIQTHIISSICQQFCFFTCKLALLAKGSSVTSPATADGRHQYRAKGGLLEFMKWKHYQTRGYKGERCMGKYCNFRKIFLWKLKMYTETRKHVTIDTFKRPGCTISLWSSLKPLCCVPFNFAFARHALSCSSWASQSMANLICESMGFSHYNNKSGMPMVTQANSILEHHPSHQGW